MNWRYELFKDASGHWRWHLVAANGRRVATSGEAFASREDAERAAHAVRANAGAAAPPAPYAAEVLAGIVAAAARRDAAHRAAVRGVLGRH
jgi:uncharacterized protein YegP (UPF0339 family)